MEPVRYHTFGPFCLDTLNRSLLRSGERVYIQPKTYEVLWLLIQNRDRVVSREELRDGVWGATTWVVESALRFQINQARKALGDDPSDPKYIKTFPKLGFQFIASVNQNAQTNIPSASVHINPEPESLFRAHLWHVVGSSTLYASLYVMALVLEVSYEFSRYGLTVLKVTPLVFIWILLTSIPGLAIDWKLTGQGRTSGLWLGLLLFVGAAAALFGLLLPVLPSSPVTQAHFQTHTAQAAYIKDSGLFLMLAILFMIMPLHIVSGIEREIRKGQQEVILALLASDKRSLAPAGTVYIKPQLLGFLLGAITIWNLITRAYVLDQLSPGPYMNFFMGLYYVHLFLFLALPAYCFTWYYRALNEIKRKCLAAVERISPS